MACSCKKNVNKKYLTDEEKLENKLKHLNGIEKVGNAFLQFFFGLFMGSIVVIGIIPLCLYIIVCMCIGKTIEVRIPKIKGLLKK